MCVGLAPDVLRVAALGHELLEIVQSLSVCQASFLLRDLREGCVNISSHVTSISTNVDMSIICMDELPQLLLVFLQKMLHIDLLLLVSGKGHVKLRQHACPLKFLQFLLVQEVFVAMATAKVKYRLTNILSLLFLPGSLLNEAHEGGDTSPGTNHDHRVTGFERQPELGSPDVHWNGGLVAVISHMFALQPVGGDTFEDSSSFGVVLDHHCTDVDAVWMNLAGGGDGVVPSLKPRQQLTQVIYRRIQRRQIL